MSDQRYGPPSLPLPLHCVVCHGRRGGFDPVAQDQWYDCEACGGTGIERFDIQQAMRDKLDKQLESAEVRRDRIMFDELNKMTAPIPGSPEAVIANLREAMATMEMHRFELPQEACQDAIDLIERMAQGREIDAVMVRRTDAMLAHCTNHMAQIYSLLYPADVKVGDSYYRFESADASEILRILSEKIRSIPEEIEKASRG